MEPHILHSLADLPEDLAGSDATLEMPIRYGLLALGGYLVAQIRHRSWFGLATAAAGVAVIQCGLTGQCSLLQAGRS